MLLLNTPHLLVPIIPDATPLPLTSFDGNLLIIVLPCVRVWS
jgi:hypothetical protein